MITVDKIEVLGVGCFYRNEVSTKLLGDDYEEMYTNLYERW